MTNPLLQSLFEEEERRPLTVTELNEQVRDVLERKFRSVWLEGEILDFSEPSSGHWYFNLHDGESQIRAACFKGTNWRIRFRPFDGLQVRVRGKLSVYTPRGDYQILVESLEPVGEGAIRVAFEQVKKKLRDEGLFGLEHKKELPFLPKKVGVVTSPTGAAIHDIVQVLTRRTRTVDILLIPAVVQGETAPESIRDGIILANQFNEIADAESRIDVLIVGRGGGSAEDLAAFNEERLARTIFDSKIPIISAVGHEIDIAISDFVADVRAATPSAAAEIVAEREDRIFERLEGFRVRTESLLELRIAEARSMLREVIDSAGIREFPLRVQQLHDRIEMATRTLGESIREIYSLRKDRYADLRQRLSPLKLSGDLGRRKTRLRVLVERQVAAIRESLSAKQSDLRAAGAGLNALSPLGVLERGYSITKDKAGKIVRSSRDVRIGEEIDVILGSGKLEARVTGSDSEDETNV